MMRNFDWSLARSFLAALDAGSLAAASRQMGISQPTLGRHIDELERCLGVLLFERGRMGMMPTEAGLAISTAARQMQSASAAMAMAATDSAESVSGTVRLTASEVVATYILPEIIAQMLIDFPEIEIELDASNEVGNLLQRDADIAVRMARPTQNDLITRQVSTLEMGVYAHRDYLKANAAPTGFEDLSSHIIIGYDRNDLIIRGFQSAGFEVERNFFRFRCDDQVTALEALVAGVGIGFAPCIVAQRFNALITVLPEFAIPGLPMWLTSHRELRHSRKIRLVNDYIGEKLKAMKPTNQPQQTPIM